MTSWSEGKKHLGLWYQSCNIVEFHAWVMATLDPGKMASIQSTQRACKSEACCCMPSCGFVFCLNNQSMPMVRCLLTLVLVSLILLPVTLIQLSGEEHLRNWGLQTRTLCSTLPCCGRGREGDSDRSASSGCTKVQSPFCINTCFSRSFFVCGYVHMYGCVFVHALRSRKSPSQTNSIHCGRFSIEPEAVDRNTLAHRGSRVCLVTSQGWDFRSH